MSVYRMVELEEEERKEFVVCSFVLFEAEPCCVDQADLKLTEMSLSLALPSPALKSCTIRQEGMLIPSLKLLGEHNSSKGLVLE